MCGDAPDWEDWFDPGARELALAIGANLRKEQIAKCERFDAALFRLIDQVSHSGFVTLVRAGPRQGHRPERNSRSLSLGLEQFAADAMHGNAVEALIEGCHQPN